MLARRRVLGASLSIVNTAPPVITGQPNVGSLLTCSTGSWTGATSYAYQWNQSGSAIVGATASTYTPVTGDDTHPVTCTVTATGLAGALAATSPAVTILGTVFGLDSFTDTAGTSLTAHTGETGATWASNTAAAYSTGAMIITNTNRVRQNGLSTNAFYISGISATADYDVEADITFVSLLTGALAGVAARMTTSADTMYQVRYVNASGYYQLIKRVAGVATTLGTPYTTAPGAGTTQHLKLSIRGTSLTVYIAGVSRITAVDSAITTAGRAGIVTGGTTTTPSDATGEQIDNFQATNA